MPPTPGLLSLAGRQTVCRSCSTRVPALAPVSALSQWRIRQQQPPQQQQLRAGSSSRARRLRAAAASDPFMRAQQRATQQQQHRERLQRLAEEASLDDDDSKYPAAAVRYFEEDPATGARTELTGGVDEFNALLAGTDAATRKALRQLDRRLARLRKMVAVLGEAEKVAADPAEVRRMLAAHDAGLERDGAMPQPPPQGVAEVVARWGATIPQVAEDKVAPGRPRARVAALNDALDKTAKELAGGTVTKRTMAALWKGYSAARTALAGRTGGEGNSWAAVPPRAWELMWPVFARQSGDNPNRMQHVHMLARDMAAAGVRLEPAQQLLAIEAMYMDGWHKEAVENWRRCVGTLGADDAGESGAETGKSKSKSSTFKEFWELGVRIYCREGDLARAERAINTLLESEQHGADPRILIPFIKASSEQSRHDLAWAAYRRMRGLLGPTMRIEDFDQVVYSFLASNQLDNALHAFVDMMSEGKIDLRGGSSSDGKQRLPMAVGNKFFFGKWMKRLIGAGDLKGTAKVVEFMLDKGVQPAPVQLNGLIGAWLRSGTAANQQKAEDLAWAMIGSRLEFVEARRGARGVGENSTEGVVAAATTPTGMPAATKETFCLLAENYRARLLHDRLLRLWDTLREAEVPEDGFMMNQLLDSYIQHNQVSEAHALFNRLTAEQGVRPDSHTFTVLWKSLSINRLRTLSDASRASDVAAGRQLFAVMAATPTAFPDGGRVDAPLARKVLHTLRKLGDAAGLLVALRALRAGFGFAPQEALVMEMVVGTENLLVNEKYSQGRFRAASREMSAALFQRRKRAGVVDAPELQRPWTADELAHYLERVVAEKAEHAIAAGEEDYEAVAREMGVYDIVAADNSPR